MCNFSYILKGKLHFDPVPHTTCLTYIYTYPKKKVIKYITCYIVCLPGNWNGVVVIKNGNKNGNIYWKTHLCKSLQHDVDGNSHNVSKYILQLANLYSWAYCKYVPYLIFLKNSHVSPIPKYCYTNVYFFCRYFIGVSLFFPK